MSKVEKIYFLLKIKIKMNIRLLIIITLLSICCIFGFEKISYSLNKVHKDDISELKILKYLPKNNKSFFISNTKISKIAGNLKKIYETKDQEKLFLVKNSILAYLGIDLGTNKLEDIYNNELLISTYTNDQKDKDDDILIIFKIKEKKDIDDILNLNNAVDEPDKLIKIFRENKLNYLKYIYRTNDNYILTSSNKNLIIDALKSTNIAKELDLEHKPFKDVLNNFKYEHNILFTKNFATNKLFINNNYSFTKDDYLMSLFNFKDKEIIIKSYLINNIKNLDIMSYKLIDKENILDQENYQLSIYNSVANYNNYLDHFKINSFEKAIFNELNKKLNQNILFLISDKNWLIIFDKNKLSIENIKLLEDFNKISLENNNKIYTIYSKDKLEIEENTVKQSYFKKIFSIQSDNLTFISNSLLKDQDIDLISKEFLNFVGDSQGKYFLNKKIIVKHPYTIQSKNISLIENINYFFKNVIDISIQEFKSIIKESIPETIPLYYSETKFKIL